MSANPFVFTLCRHEITAFAVEHGFPIHFAVSPAIIVVESDRSVPPEESKESAGIITSFLARLPEIFADLPEPNLVWDDPTLQTLLDRIAKEPSVGYMHAEKVITN